ncbi:MAG: hypothetical protein RBU29_13970, partial [bacterium]|nr:hypothetical protein [bacterium]
MTIETSFVQLHISPNGKILHCLDRRTGTEFLNPTADPTFAMVRIGQQSYPASKMTQEGDFLRVQFEETDFQMKLQVKGTESFILIKVVETQGQQPEELIFCTLSLIPGAGPDPLVGCALALNLQTRVREIPQANTLLRAMAYTRFGLVGAEVAWVLCPQSLLRDTLQAVVSQAPALPRSTIGGPWAWDADMNRGSYLFNFDGMTPESVEEWIELAQTLGITQIDFHGGSSFRFGDCFPDPEVFPEGKASFKKIIDRLHEAGIAAGLHTYAFFIDKQCPWVTPVPDPRLAKDALFTLASDLPADATTIPVVEDTTAMSAVTGFFVRNSATLQIGDELITYKAVKKDPPYAFLDCQRGAHGTTVATHAGANPVHHLKECFGLFVPDPETSLLAEVAARTADMFNECGFDMIYLDALDGEDILGGGEAGWHYGSTFAYELVSRLHKSPLMEMSTFHHHLWVVRARMGAWDHPNRGHKRFIDLHCEANQAVAKMFLPSQLGWWAIKTWNGIQTEPTFADDIEYLCGKSIGNGSGLSIMGINPKNRNRSIYQRLAKIIKNYETLRHAKYFNEEIKAQLRVPGAEFTLKTDPSNQWRLYPAHIQKQNVTKLGEGGNRWEATNPYAAQPLRCRLEALTAAVPYEATQSIPLCDFSSPFQETAAAPGVAFTIEPSTAPSQWGDRNGQLTITNQEQSDAKAAWGRASLHFEKPLDLSQNQALGVWIHGDGKGAVLNFQMKSPEHLISGLAERYVVLDFEGWKYFELVELESDRYLDYRWPYGHPYSIFRETVHFSQIESLTIWCTNVPKGEFVTCTLAPIKAVPHRSVTIHNPSLTIGGQTLTFPVGLETGQY